MIRNKSSVFLLFLFFLICSNNTLAYFAINLFRGYDINLLPPEWCGSHGQATGWGEFAYKTRAFNPLGHEVNVMQLWTEKQDALAMLRGFPSDSPITQFLQNVIDNPQDDGQRGNFLVKGSLDARAYGMFIRGYLPHNFIVGLYLPWYDMRLHNIKFQDCTQDLTQEDMIVKEELTDQLFARVNEFDPTLNLHGWHRVGFGDLIFMSEWARNFKQQKPTLKNVLLTARAGLNMPTGVKKNEDDILSIPFGFDGSWALIFGGGIILDWYDRIYGWIDVEFDYIFGNTRLRRIKVQQQQTDFLLLAKVMTHKDFGFTQRYNLMLTVDPIIKGLSADVIYQFFKHNEDKLSVCTNQFSDQIANTAESLQEWTMHQMIFKLNYDFKHIVPEKSWLKPYVSLFAKWPFNGERALMCNTLGFIVTLNF